MAEDDNVTDDLSSLLTGDSSQDTTTLADAVDSISTEVDTTSSTTVNSDLLALIKPGYGLVYEQKDTARINRILQREDVQALIPNTMKFLWAVKPFEGEGISDEKPLELYAIKKSRSGRAPLTGETITDARQDLDERSRPAISMQMNATGAKAWKRLTASNINKRIAIVS